MGFWSWLRGDSRVEQRSLMSVSDPALAALFQVGNPNYSGVTVGESTALGISAVYRAVSLISQTIASLPMRTVRDVDGVRTRVRSFLDSPGGPDGPTRFEWVETVMCHLLLHGNAYLYHVYNGAGAIVALEPIHPLCVGIEHRPNVPGGKLFRVSLEDGRSKTLTADDMTHVPALSTDGVLGLSPISVARNSLGTAVAGDRAAARMLESGAMITGFISSDEDVTEDDAKVIRDTVNRNATGWENAGGIPVFNRNLKFTALTMSAQDSQFLQTRQFQVEEIARWFGVPPHLLMLTEKSTSWGTGIEEQNRALARTVLAPWTARVEQRLSRLLRDGKFVEFDFAGLERPTPESEIDLLIKQVDAGVITVNEYRRIRNMPPLPGGDIPRSPQTASEPREPVGVAA